jgi:hypothetical protein
VESIIADHVIAARSERAVRCAASRWGLALGISSPFTIWHRILAPPPCSVLILAIVLLAMHTLPASVG